MLYSVGEGKVQITLLTFIWIIVVYNYMWFEWRFMFSVS